MKRFVLFATMSLALLVAVGAANADDRSFQMTDGNYGMIYGAPAPGKADRDTTWLLGGPGRYDGRFEDAAGNPNWQGWTHRDMTTPGENHWHVTNDAIQPPGGALVGNFMWLGRYFNNACQNGYGSGWADNLVFTYNVPDNTVNTVVRLECVFNNDSEDTWDFLYIQRNRGGTWEDLAAGTGLDVNVVFDQNITFTPADYTGPSANQVQLRFRGESDSNTDDQDCANDTDGLAQVDNIRVTIGANVFYEDHEDGDNDYWVLTIDGGVGDFAKIWSNLQDVDPCVTNLSPQVAFIDDGVVVPGTGGTPGVTWTYGPGGYIVNNTGGLMGPTAHLDNLLFSPVMEWVEGNDGAILTYDVYRHEDLSDTSPGIFYQWHVRSAVNPDDLELAPWQDRNFVYYGRSYLSDVEPVTDLLEPGRTVVQVSLRCIEYGYNWGWDGVDGTPAPYFDNVAFKIFPFTSPSIALRDIDLANDNFPERGDLDLSNLANNWIRFDAAQNISPDADLRNDPGDSIWVDIGLPRAGAVLNEMPKLVVKMKANELFDDVRVLPPNFSQTGDIIDGWVYGDSTRSANGTPVPNRYEFDLPDSNFFFPGDVIHYYITASDNLGGDIGTATVPADISAIGEFGGLFPYDANSTFIVRGLPTLFDQTGAQPPILFWNDFANRGGENEWYLALNNLGYNEHLDYDVFYTNGPSSGVGNGIGGRATSQTIGGYECLLYTAGDLSTNLISNGDYANDPSNDLSVLSNWFEQGDKKAFLTGDDLIFSLTASGGAAQTFLDTYLRATLVNNNILPLIANQTAPTVQPVPGNSVFTTPDAWVAFGGCLGINDFDAIRPGAGAEQLARFLSPSGTPYDYSAAQRYTNVADVIYMPYDFMYIYNPTDYEPNQPGWSARTEVLRDVLIEFGLLGGGEVIDVPDGALVFGVSNYPNPFNPATEIKMTLPQPGHVSLKVFNVRGELVRTLVDGDLEAGVQTVTWNGTNDTGRQVASGVYFYETRYNGETTINKMALVK